MSSPKKGSRPLLKGSRPLLKGSRPLLKGSQPQLKGSRPLFKVKQTLKWYFEATSHTVLTGGLWISLPSIAGTQARNNRAYREIKCARGSRTRSKVQAATDMCL